MLRLRIVCVLVSIAANGVVTLQDSSSWSDRWLRAAKVFTVSIVTVSVNGVASVAFESIPVVNAFLPGAYVLESLNSPSCEIQNGVLDASVPVVLSVAPIPARSTVTCSLKMSRSLTSDQPAGLGIRTLGDHAGRYLLVECRLVVRTVVDLSLHVEQIQPLPAVGERIGFVRVAVHNTGPWYIDQVNFGYCQDLVVAPFELDNTS